MVKIEPASSSLHQGKRWRGLFLLLAVILLIGNMVLFFSVYGFRLGREAVGSFLQDLSSFKFHAFAFLIVWGIIFGMLGIAAQHHQIVQETSLPPAPKKEETPPLKKAFTDLDVLYATLLKQKSLTLPAIAEIFHIDKEKALEWSKILESHDLASIHYHVFRDAELTLKEES